MVFSCVDSVGVVVNVRDDAAVETAAAGATAVKGKFRTAGDEEHSFFLAQRSSSVSVVNKC